METNIYDLAKRIEGIIHSDPNKFSSSGIRVFRAGDFSHKELLENECYIYIFYPSGNLQYQDKVKEEIWNYTRSANWHFVLTTPEDCGEPDCHGDYVNPFGLKVEDKYLFVDKFPEYLNGSSVHFLNQENYHTFRSIRGWR